MSELRVAVERLTRRIRKECAESDWAAGFDEGYAAGRSEVADELDELLAEAPPMVRAEVSHESVTGPVVKVAGIRRGELVYTMHGQALIRTDIPVSCSSNTLRAIADLLDELNEVAR